MSAIAALVAGLLFGVGLLVSGMTNPANIIAFLDVAGAWQPSLALTMAAAVAVALPACAVGRRRASRAVVMPIARRRIDGSLLVGSAIFGVGWGLSGICPGPGLIILVSGDARAIVFVACVALGIFAAGALRRGDAGLATDAA